MAIFMPVKLHRGQKLTLTDKVTYNRMYGDGQFTADVVIEIDHEGLIELVRKAAHKHGRRSKDGPVVVKVKNVVGH